MPSFPGSHYDQAREMKVVMALQMTEEKERKEKENSQRNDV